ncbi:TonB-dependent receptor [Microbulbifer thermotolerans]|uniref:TonB-dependent receptor n=1 Tax=Microbulbifer thermotolerans TaxID=252514 RepID=A0AB35HUW6_MICTH|nr:TonB-dependent receptor [Microbulbifer thermotolerans]MCX2779407.1 TonB-dependent receptor [Microbulbifer thermotolerans]MCX2782389.1 TonB-dependent receptor [Microbulbifer thermotolerans]MCX2794974.1 TonB-dependent receptor [Microbulbifer thermotolerans]MCX2800542.1 TonB-dependent receptor [Microbulbifer thermotolerans]MCX2805691.1 TonB-dependent receptor [Microbulbifer thermotolerans]
MAPNNKKLLDITLFNNNKREDAMMHDADQSWKTRQFRLSTLSGAIAFATAISGTAYAAEIEEVVVTAQKRAENLQEVPIAISAVTGENMKAMGIKNLTDLGKSTPGVEMNNDTPLQPTYNIRGIQTSDFTVGSDPAVAVYIDGVYNGRGAGAEVPLADIERVEVLKGPQGTLFGRNATGGAIHIITRKPQADDTTELNITAGNYGRQSVDLLVNRQLSDNLYGRITASTNRRDSFADNLAGDFTAGNQDTQTYRASLLWEPTPDTEVLWRAEYGVMDQGSALRSSIVPTLQAMDGGSDVFEDYALDTPTIEDRDSFGTSLTITSDFDNFTFTSITAFSKFDAHLQQDEDGTANPDYMFGSANFDEQEQFSQEFRLNGATDTLKWTLGLSYSQEKLEHLTDAYFTSGSLESFAVYEGLKGNPEAFGIPQSVFDQMTTTEKEDLAAQIRSTMAAGGIPAMPEGSAVSTFVYDLLVQSGQADALLQQLGAPSGVTASMLDRNQMIAQLMAGIAPWVMADIPWTESVFNTGDYRSAAIYGDFTWSLTDRMDLTIGARYTADEKDFTIESSYQNTLPIALAGGAVDLIGPDGSVIGQLPIPAVPSCDTAASAPCIPAERFGMAFNNNGIADLYQELDDSWSDISGRIVLDYRWNDEIMTYVSLSEGFKAGGFNSFSAAEGIDPSFDQEDVTNLEIGLKSNLFDNRVQLNAAVYSYEYDNLQELDLVGKPIPNYYLRNADAEGQGMELEVVWAASDNLLIAGNYSHLETEYTRYQILEAAGETEEDSLVGEPRVGTPENKFNLMAEYNFELASGANVVLRGDYNWTDERVGTVDDPTRVVDDYQLLNLRLGWNSASDRYSAALWVQNATDEEIVGGYGGTGSAIGASPAWRYMPRMYGADFTVRF